MWQHPCIYTRYEGNESAFSFFFFFLQTELKGLMDLTAYFIWKSCGPRQDPCHIFQLSAVVLSFVPCSTCRGETDRQGGGRGGGGELLHLWVSLLPRKPCLAYLTPVSDDITGQDGPLRAGDSLHGSAWTQRQAGYVCVCVCLVRGGSVLDTND